MPVNSLARSLRRSLAVCLALAMAGCATSAPRLSVDIDTCCEGQFERYETYQVTMNEMPGFLSPYLEGGLDTVLAGKGLSPTLDTPDLRIVLLFEQIYLNEGTAGEPAFGESIAPGDADRFMAAVKVDVFDNAADRLLWSGRLSRLHQQQLGQPRGNDHKMQGIVDGFAVLFADYPIRLDDDMDP